MLNQVLRTFVEGKKVLEGGRPIQPSESSVKSWSGRAETLLSFRAALEHKQILQWR